MDGEKIVITKEKHFAESFLSLLQNKRGVWSRRDHLFNRMWFAFADKCAGAKPKICVLVTHHNQSLTYFENLKCFINWGRCCTFFVMAFGSVPNCGASCGLSTGLFISDGTDSVLRILATGREIGRITRNQHNAFHPLTTRGGDSA